MVSPGEPPHHSITSWWDRAAAINAALVAMLGLGLSVWCGAGLPWARTRALRPGRDGSGGAADFLSVSNLDWWSHVQYPLTIFAVVYCHAAWFSPRAAAQRAAAQELQQSAAESAARITGGAGRRRGRPSARASPVPEGSRRSVCT